MTTDSTPLTDHDAVTPWSDSDRRDVARWLVDEADKRVRFFPQRRDGVDALVRHLARLAARDAVLATAQGPGVAEVLRVIRYDREGRDALDHPWCLRLNCAECVKRGLVEQVLGLAAAGQPTTQPAPEATTVTEEGR